MSAVTQQVKVIHFNRIDELEARIKTALGEVGLVYDLTNISLYADDYVAVLIFNKVRTVEEVYPVESGIPPTTFGYTEIR